MAQPLVEIILAAELAARHSGPTLAAARRMADRAEAEARRMGIPVCIALCDAEGGQILFHRMEGSLPASVALAPGKAWTAASYRMGSDEVGRLAAPGGMLAGLNAGGGPVVTFGGGLPVRAGGRVIGAIGISGGTVEEDMQIARAAIAWGWGATPEEGQCK